MATWTLTWAQAARHPALTCLDFRKSRASPCATFRPLSGFLRFRQIPSSSDHRLPSTGRKGFFSSGPSFPKRRASIEFAS